MSLLVSPRYSLFALMWCKAIINQSFRWLFKNGLLTHCFTFEKKKKKFLRFKYHHFPNKFQKKYQIPT